MSYRYQVEHQSPQQGFTLVELCLVLLVLSLFLGLMVPSVRSAFQEHRLRQQASQLALLIRFGMIESSQLKSSCALVLKDHQAAILLQPESEQARVLPKKSVSGIKLSPDCSLQVLDLQSTTQWAETSTHTWQFEPDELCPLLGLRLSEGKSWLQFTFNPLTGNIEREQSYFP